MKLLLTKRFTAAVAGNWFALLLFALSSLVTTTANAASVRDIAPTAGDAPVMLDAENPEFGNFASFTSAPNNRLVATIGSPDEILYFGLSAEFNDDGEPYSSTATSAYRFRVRRITADGSNPVVHGPFTINNDNANVNSYAEAEFGVFATTEEQNGQQVFVFRPGQAGDYSIEFTDVLPDRNRRILIPFWNFTVTDAANNVIDGRVWSRSWSFRTPPIDGDDLPDCEFDREFNGDFFSYTEDGFVSRIDFANAGFVGLSFDIAFNSTGPGNTGDIQQDRMSVPNANVTSQAAQHRIFLSLPDENLFPSGECGSVTAAEAFRCTGDDTYCLDVTVTDPGQVEVVLDFDGNGRLDDNDLDVSIAFEFTEGNLSACIPWDGLRADGQQVNGRDTVDVIINYAQGIQHWSAYDVEFMRNGFCVETVRPVCAQMLSSNTLYWDDRDIPEDPGTGVTKDNRTGADCREVPRSWNNFAIADGEDCDTRIDENTTGYGDKSTLNTYWFANSSVELRARVPLASVSIEGDLGLCEGGTSVLRAIDNSNDDIVSLEWNGPNGFTATSEVITVTEPGEYCVTVVSALGCTNTVCVNVIIVDFDVDIFPPSITVCPGESVQIQPAGPDNLTYSWSPATGINDPASNQPVFSPAVTTEYTVTITNTSANGSVCSGIDTVLVIASPDIGLVVTGGDDNLTADSGNRCDDTRIITATTATPADISLSDGVTGSLIETRQNTQTANFSVAVSGTRSYVVTAVNSDGCSEAEEVTVSGGPVNIAVADTITACLGQEVDLSVQNLDGNDQLTFVYSPANLFAPGTETTDDPDFTAGAGSYQVTVTATNQFGCTATETIGVFIIDEADQLSFTSESECDGLTVNFTNTSSVGFGYLWLFGDGTFSTEVNPSHTYPAPGSYDVTLSLQFDQECVDDFTATVSTAQSLLQTSIAAVSITDIDGSSAAINFTNTTVNTSGEALTYSWTFSGAGVTPTTSSEPNPSVVVTMSGTVTATLTVANESGCTATATTSVTVQLNDVNLPDTIFICPGESAELNPGGTNNGSQIYTWMPSPDFDASAANPSTMVPGTYTVMLTSNNGDFNSTDNDTVVVIEFPFTPNDFPGEVTTCFGRPVTILGGPAVPGYTYVFDPADGLDLSDPSNPVGTFTENTTITVTILDPATGCTDVQTIQINVSPELGFMVSPGDTSICEPDMITFTGTTVSDDATITWFSDEDLTNQIATGPTVVVDASDSDQTYTVYGEAVDVVTGCTDTISRTVTVSPFMPNDFPDTVMPCFAEAFTIMGGDAVEGYTYTYNTGQNLDLTDPANPIGNFTEDTSIEVTITDPVTGCSSVQIIEVDVAPEISFMTSPADTSICAPGMVEVTGTSVNDAVDITWYSDEDLNNQIGTGSSIMVDAAVQDSTYTVYGQAIDPNTGCEQVATVTITVSGLNTGLPLTDVNLCAGDDPSSLFAPGTFNPDFTYTYEPEDVVDLSDENDPRFAGTQNETITVMVTDPSTGCTAERTINAVYTDLSMLDGMADPEMIILGDVATLTVTGCDTCEYDWMAPNGSVTPDDAASVEVMPTEAGALIYDVLVTSNGCSETVMIELQVDDPLCEVDRVYIPNAFTPNGDGRNETIFVRSAFANQITEFRWIIYDRWGQEVFSADDIDAEWDGTYQGDDLEPDVYGYWCRVICPTGEELIQQGNITILR